MYMKKMRFENIVRWFKVDLFLFCVLLCSLELLCPASARGQLFDGGDGTADNPFLLSTAEQLQYLGDYAHNDLWDKHFRLTSDINLSQYSGTEFNIIGSYSSPFTGVFDGNGFVIQQFHYTDDGATASHIGLFGFLDGDAVIKNLTLSHPNIEIAQGGFSGALVGTIQSGTVQNVEITYGLIKGENFMGGLAGNNEGGLIDNCRLTSCTVSGEFVIGGLVGKNGDEGIISNCKAALLNINETPGTGILGDIGGLVGSNDGTIEDCSYVGTINCPNSNFVGGLVGFSNAGTIANSLAISGNITGGLGVGGLIGISRMSITDSFFGGTITGGSNVGGLAGTNDEGGTIVGCFSSRSSNINGDSSVGGIAGMNKGAIEQSFSNGNVNSTSIYAGGLVGNNYGSIANCYAQANVASSSFYVGGLVGQHKSEGSIVNSYSTGQVTGSSFGLGGLIGKNRGGTIIESFWDTEASQIDESDGGSGLSTVEMTTRSTYLAHGWDFMFEADNGTTDIWTICDGRDYPHLSWEYTLANINICNRIIQFDDFVYIHNNWLSQDCGPANSYCSGADLDRSGTVDFADLLIFAENWLSGIPQT